MTRGRTPSSSWLLGLACVVALLVIAYQVVELRRLRDLVSSVAEAAPPPASPPITPRGELSPAERSMVELFRRASSSVVHITTMDLQSDPFRMRLLEIPKGTGSGFFWDNGGHVVTNLHVIQGAKAARVTLPDHSVWSAELVGVSARNDLAVLRISGAMKKAKPLPIGTSHDLSVGQLVAAIGSPFGLDYTLSTGIVSGLGREINGEAGLPIRDVIQTDAAINPGNSGGPLLDSSGRLIGVNTAILSPSGASAGIGFAVPVDTVARVVPQLIRYHREVRPAIGVDLVNDVVARRLGVPGVLILQIRPNSPAAKVGLRATLQDRYGRVQVGDVIVGLDDSGVRTSREFYGALDEKQPGDPITLHVVRDGERLALKLTLAANIDL